MAPNDRLVLAVVLVTALVLVLVGLTGLLLVVNANRRHRYRAQLAEADLRREQEVMKAEREATQQTLREVGRELHDNVGQLLSVVQMGHLRARKLGALPAELAHAGSALDQAVEEVRRLGRSLNTDLWTDRTLADAISHDAERIERVGRVRTTVQVQGELPVLPPNISTILFRVYQEVVNNALKHSAADHIAITLTATPALRLTIADNGRGFDPAATSASAGLHNIRRRCQVIGFEAQCTSAPGSGCTWTITSDHP